MNAFSHFAWEWMLVVGVVFGMTLSFYLTGNRTRLMVPASGNGDMG